jgi:hypothetical protein
MLLTLMDDGAGLDYLEIESQASLKYSWLLEYTRECIITSGNHILRLLSEVLFYIQR